MMEAPSVYCIGHTTLRLMSHIAAWGAGGAPHDTMASKVAVLHTILCSHDGFVGWTASHVIRVYPETLLTMVVEVSGGR